MDPRAEFIELVRQATEHLRYYRELGLTHIGEAPAEGPAPVLSSSAKALPSNQREDQRAGSQAGRPPVAEPASPAPATAASAEPVKEQPKRQAETMAKSTSKKEKPAAAVPSLFGDVAAPPVEEKFGNETLDDIRADMGDCHRCKLWQTRTQLVFGEGSAKAELMFVGEAPGADEDMTGRPFVGRAGQLLNKMIEAIGMKREEVYIANVIKSRPPGNRNPEKDEIAACIPFLFRQIATIKPRLIVTLGNPATQELLETKTGITKIRGEFQDYPRLAGVKVLPTFHPAYLLRSPDKKREAWEDLKKVRAFLRGEINL